MCRLSGARRAFILASVLVLLLFESIASAIIRPPAATNGFRTDRIIVKLSPSANASLLESALNSSGCKSRAAYPSLGNLHVIELPSGVSAEAGLRLIRRLPGVEYAEPDYVLQAARVPNEPRYADGSLYHLFNWGQLGGTVDCDIDAAEGWDLAFDATSVIVSVLDTGTRVTHEDLTANLWRNPGEIAGNGLDDDNNGYIDDVHGINAMNDSGDLTDTFGHGTHVAGILGAVGNNGIGVVGTAWNARIMTCKFLDNQLQGSLSDALECIEYSRVNGARIINASWGGTTTNVFGAQALYDAINSLRQHGIIFVAAAGNFSLNNDAIPRFYPASFDLDNIVSVAATTRDDDIAHFSDYGLNTVDLGAPGYIVLSTWAGHDSSYALDDGTSMAAPQVAAACALAWAKYPGSTYQQIIARVLAGTDPIPALAGKCKTGGRLNLHKVLSQPDPAPHSAPRVIVLGMESGKFRYRVEGVPNGSFHLQTSLDGKSWTPGTTFQMPPSGHLDFDDFMSNGAKLYRAVKTAP